MSEPAGPTCFCDGKPATLASRGAHEVRWLSAEFLEKLRTPKRRKNPITRLSSVVTRDGSQVRNGGDRLPRRGRPCGCLGSAAPPVAEIAARGPEPPQRLWRERVWGGSTLPPVTRFQAIAATTCSRKIGKSEPRPSRSRRTWGTSSSPMHQPRALLLSLFLRAGACVLPRLLFVWLRQLQSRCAVSH